MKLTVGMATFDDYDGVYFTIQALRMYHKEVINNIEIIVVDNKPDTKGSGFIKNLLDNWVKDTAGAKYIPMPEPQGTTQPRNRIFTEATGDAVLCMDSHVLIEPGALDRLISYYEGHPNSRDLLSGPMLYDDLNVGNTHFDDVWRAEMWGIWGKAWTHEPGCSHFTVLNNKNQCDYRCLAMGLEPLTRCSCGKELPNLPYSQHEKGLTLAGFNLAARSVNDPPFAIPGMGLGLFTCRRDAWLGFSPHFRGFGGEEMYIHEKYRQAGAEALCLPFLRWGHRFGRPNGIPYVKILTRWNKIRNYVIGLQELGLPLDHCYEHFVTAGLMQEWEWNSLLEDPIGREAGPIKPAGLVLPPRNSPQRPQPRAAINSEGELLAWCKSLPSRDLDKHLDTLAQYAAKCDHVTEITHRRESTIGLLPAKKIKSFQAERDPLIQRLLDIFPEKIDVTYLDNLATAPTIGETDLTFIDTVHTAARLYAELTQYAPLTRKYIIMHDTQLHSEKGEDGGPGLLTALRRFMREQPEWSVIYHTANQFGLTVITKLDSEKPKRPSLLTMAANFTEAAQKYAADGFTNVSKEQYEERLGICSTCEHRTNNSCAICGCGLAAKAAGRAFECPLGKWPPQ